MTIAVLGAGMVGRTIALDLAGDYAVISLDINAQNLELVKEKNGSIKTVLQNLQDYSSYAGFLKPANIVVVAVPGFMGYKALQAVINCGKNVVDISFSPEDALQLDALAKEKNVTAIVDAGVAPGMSNYIIGRYNKEMKIDDFEIYVGGLPLHPKPPFYYKAPFSPIDVIEEYTRPARMKVDGRIITKPALTEIEILHFDGPGTLEAFNTDGLRSLLFTMSHIPNQKEKTLRYPGHVRLVQALQQIGFFNKEMISVDGSKISPLAFTSKILLNEWKMDETEEELTVMKVLIHGEGKTIQFDLLDYYDTKTQTSSMARTTGYTCTASVNLVAKNMFAKKGVFPPELIGDNKDCFNFIVNYLKDRSVNWKIKV